MNGYVRGADVLRGYWAWIGGVPVPLPPISVPVLVYGEPDFTAFRLDHAQRLHAEYQALAARHLPDRCIGQLPG